MKLKLSLLFFLIINFNLYSEQIATKNKIDEYSYTDYSSNCNNIQNTSVNYSMTNKECNFFILGINSSSFNGGYFSNGTRVKTDTILSCDYNSITKTSNFTQQIKQEVSCPVVCNGSKVWNNQILSCVDKPTCTEQEIYNSETNTCELPCEPIPNHQEIAYEEEECNIEHIISTFPEDGSPNYVKKYFLVRMSWFLLD